MKKISIILMIMIQTSYLFGQIDDNNFPIGSWIGTVEMDESSPRLVFHITSDSIGAFAGTVDSPARGVSGIRLSRVYVEADSAVFEISAALASFEGVFTAKKDAIVGIWKEADTAYPLTLNFSIDTVNSIIVKRHPFEIQQSSEHFEFYSSDSDLSLLDDIANTLEDNYMRVTGKLQTQFTDKIQVLIYPDIKSFHASIFMPHAPDWVVAAARKNELVMVSPLNPGDEHTYASLMKAIVHELTHTAVLNLREQGLAGLPKWLNEGYAYYEANQMTDEWRESLKERFTKEELPTWTQLDNANINAFGDMEGYGLSTIIIEFLVKEYGFDKLRQLILTPKQIESIYGFSSNDLEKQWAQYLRED